MKLSDNTKMWCATAKTDMAGARHTPRDVIGQLWKILCISLELFF